MEMKQYDENGSEAGMVTLSAELFGVDPSLSLIHQAVVTRLANRRQGTASVKGRSDVHGTNRKPFRQKKTGNARRGDLKTNLQRGGGVAFGPEPRSYRQKFPKKMRRAALASALSIRAKEDAVNIINDVTIESGKTRDAVAFMKALGFEDRRVLLVTHGAPESLLRAARNIPNLVVMAASNLHPYEIMWSERVVITDSALSALTGDSES